MQVVLDFKLIDEDEQKVFQQNETKQNKNNNKNQVVPKVSTSMDELPTHLPDPSEIPKPKADSTEATPLTFRHGLTLMGRLQSTRHRGCALGQTRARTKS